ncbi:thioredoxin family protein [Spirosoma sordidisoli]|uniref:DUF255 domain-containing protein n=1 Tax=Spirosoma sordidisoli TaxID=2502893 RepID=A0A4Q2URL7_9BACT|nr:thioredoxin family protein [Spirosoma sordidisoli]RYC71672.1 DUF255 domain-containing protein [Spirosoma sordidisoli]
MKRLISVCVLCLLLINVRADEPMGMRFFVGSWQQALAEARNQHKPLFVDFYTAWCPPCRRMAREAFPNPAIGDAFNGRFINYQLNAEVGEGPDVARQYGVGSYPTGLYLTPTGELVHRSVGYAGVNAMIQQADLVWRMPRLRRSISKRNRVYTEEGK